MITPHLGDAEIDATEHFQKQVDAGPGVLNLPAGTPPNLSGGGLATTARFLFAVNLQI